MTCFDGAAPRSRGGAGFRFARRCTAELNFAGQL
jgi:hypothetical protein